MYQDSRREAQPLKPRVRVEVLPNPKMGAPTSNCTLVSAAGRFRAHLLPEVLEEVAGARGASSMRELKTLLGCWEADV